MKPITWIQPTTAHNEVCFSFRRWINLARLRYANSRIKLTTPPQAAARRNPNPSAHPPPPQRPPLPAPAAAAPASGLSLAAAVPSRGPRAQRPRARPRPGRRCARPRPPRRQRPPPTRRGPHGSLRPSALGIRAPELAPAAAAPARGPTPAAPALGSLRPPHTNTADLVSWSATGRGASASPVCCELIVLLFPCYAADLGVMMCEQPAAGIMPAARRSRSRRPWILSKRWRFLATLLHLGLW